MKKIIRRNNIRRILIRSANWVGDAVMSTPMVHAIRRNFPGARIDILAKPWVAPVFEHSPDVDRIRLLDSGNRHKGVAGMTRLAGELRKERYDLAVLVPNSFGSALIPRLSGIPRILGYATDGRDLLLTHRVRRTAAHLRRHQTAYYLRILEGAGLEPGAGAKGDPQAMRLSTRPAERREAAALVAAELAADLVSDRPWIGVNPGAAFGSAKRWPADRYATLIRSVKEKRPEVLILIFGSPGEAELGERIRRDSGTDAVGLAGKTSLRQAICLIEQCRAFVTNDSGLMHIAAAFDIPQIAIFGPTKTTTTSPYSANARMIREPVECAPCMKAECPPPHEHECMTGISAKKVETALLGLLDG